MIARPILNGTRARDEGDQLLEPDHPYKQPGIPVLEHRTGGPLEVWVHACAGIFGVAPINKSDADKEYRVDSWFVDPITIVNSKFHATVTRHSNWHIEESGNQIHVHRYALGRASVETAGIPIECETGAVTLLDYARPFTSVHTQNDSHSFFVPHEAIGYRPSDDLHAPVYSVDSVMGHVIGQEMDNLLGQVQSGVSAIQPSDVQRFLGCVEVAMCPEKASRSARAYARASLKRSIQIFIEERLPHLDLCVSTVLQTFGVSRATLYRMFEAEDGVRNYIGQRRLFRAVTHLAENPLRRGQIHEVSERWGFSSDASFNRVVRREFGVAPGSLFQAPISGPVDFQPLSIVQTHMIQAAKREVIPA